jgi:hypothetical protein
MGLFEKAFEFAKSVVTYDVEKEIGKPVAAGSPMGVSLFAPKGAKVVSVGKTVLGKAGAIYKTLFKAAPKTTIAGTLIAPAAVKTLVKEEKVREDVFGTTKDVSTFIATGGAYDVGKEIIESDNPWAALYQKGKEFVSEHPVLAGGAVVATTVAAASTVPAGVAFVAGQILGKDDLPKDSRKESPAPDKVLPSVPPMTVPKASPSATVTAPPTSSPVAIPSEKKTMPRASTRRRTRCPRSSVTGNMRLNLRWT